MIHTSTDYSHRLNGTSIPCNSVTPNRTCGSLGPRLTPQKSTLLLRSAGFRRSRPLPATESWSSLPSSASGHTVDGSEIRRAPVEVGSLSHCTYEVLAPSRLGLKVTPNGGFSKGNHTQNSIDSIRPLNSSPLPSIYGIYIYLHLVNL